MREHERTASLSRRAHVRPRTLRLMVPVPCSLCSQRSMHHEHHRTTGSVSRAGLSVSAACQSFTMPAHLTHFCSARWRE